MLRAQPLKKKSQGLWHQQSKGKDCQLITKGGQHDRADENFLTLCVCVFNTKQNQKELLDISPETFLTLNTFCGIKMCVSF